MGFVELKDGNYINLENVERVNFGGYGDHIITIYFSSGKVEEFEDILVKDTVFNLKKRLREYGVSFE